MQLTQWGAKNARYFAINRTSKIKWLKKLFLLRESNKCRILAWYLFNIKMSEFKNKLSVEYKDKCLTLFHKQVFDSWQHFYSKPPYTVEDIWHEHLLENKYVCSNGIPLKPSEFNVPRDAANNLVIADIVSNNGNIVCIEEFNLKVQKSIGVMSFNRVTSATRNRTPCCL